MGWIGRLLSFERGERNDAKVSTAICDPGGGDLTSCDHFAPAGDDSHPLKTDYALGVNVQRTGASAAVAYADPINAPKALEGDKRIYARDASTGAMIVEVWLKNDGTATLVNSNGSITLSPAGSIAGVNGGGNFELQAGGDFVVNGVTIAADGSVDIPSSLTLSGKEIAGHTHAINGGSSSPGPTGANN